MKQLLTRAIILSRTDFGEADRILTLLTPEHGKLRLMARGVRRIKSKLAGGIELFCVSDITYIKGRSDIGTLVSTRLLTYYSSIVKDVNRTMLGYDLIKVLHKATEDEPESEYFDLLEQAFGALDDNTVQVDPVRTWFQAQLLRLSGHTPNLTYAAGGDKLTVDKTYDFSFEDDAFISRPDGAYASDDIKFLRILFSETDPLVIAKVGGVNGLVGRTQKMVQLLAQQYTNH